MLSAINTFFKPGKKKCYLYREGSSREFNQLGLKGSKLCELFRLGIPTPAGFIIGRDCSNECLNDNANLLSEDLKKMIHELEQQTGKTFGSVDSDHFPLLLSIRASASCILPTIEAGCTSAGLGSAIRRQAGVLPDSWLLPGCSSTALNIGMNDEVLECIARRAGSRFALDTYARFLLYYGVVVGGMQASAYYDVLGDIISATGRGKFTI